MWLERLLMREAEPLARGRKRDVRLDDVEVGSAHAVVVLGVGDGREQHLLDVRGDCTGAEAQDVEGGGGGLAADEIDYNASLTRSDAHVLGDGTHLAGLSGLSCHR